MNKKLYVKFAIIFFTLVTILSINSVDNKLTSDDYEYITKILNNKSKISKESSYLEELEFINSIQNALLKAAPNSGSIPKNKPREPKDVYMAGMSGCSERARVLSKIFKYYGFKSRQFSMYSNKTSSSSISVLLTPRVRSHAAIEVLTKKGWLVVDPNIPWVAIDTLNNPLSISKIQHDVDNLVYINWKKPPELLNPDGKELFGIELSVPDEIYINPFIYIHGLYSRHGKFYPPFNFIPDINYGELIQNVF